VTCKPFKRALNTTSGFSLLELVIVSAILLIALGISVPQCVNAMRMARLRGAVSDFAGLVQVQRVRALDDNRYYSSYVRTATGVNPGMAFVDVFPQNANGSSGTGGTYTAGDPMVAISQEIRLQPAAAAPNTANLKLQLLPANSPVGPLDGSAAGTPVTFSTSGLPCTPSAVTGGTVCNTLGGPTAYWSFFQNTVSQSWGAVTVTPAGRISRWYLTGGANGTWASY
jgi:prepilin-type N-terminal cleavage/methylation domain-containing protein